MDLRELKALEIAARSRIMFKDGVWLVPSQTSMTITYRVGIGSEPSCTCEDFALIGPTGRVCKHITAARERRSEGAGVLAAVLAPLRDERVDGAGLDGRRLLGADDPLEVVQGGLHLLAGAGRQAGEHALLVLPAELLPGLAVVALVGAGQQLGGDLLPLLLGDALALGAGAAALASLLALGVEPADLPAGRLGAVLLDLLVVLVDPRARHDGCPF
jgi:hypothetical protein